MRVQLQQRTVLRIELLHENAPEVAPCFKCEVATTSLLIHPLATLESTRC